MPPTLNAPKSPTPAPTTHTGPITGARAVTLASRATSLQSLESEFAALGVDGQKGEKDSGRVGRKEKSAIKEKQNNVVATKASHTKIHPSGSRLEKVVKETGKLNAGARSVTKGNPGATNLTTNTSTSDLKPKKTSRKVSKTMEFAPHNSTAKSTNQIPNEVNVPRNQNDKADSTVSCWLETVCDDFGSKSDNEGHESVPERATMARSGPVLSPRDRLGKALPSASVASTFTTTTFNQYTEAMAPLPSKGIRELRGLWEPIWTKADIPGTLDLFNWGRLLATKFGKRYTQGDEDSVEDREG